MPIVNCTNAKPLKPEHALHKTHVRCLALKKLVPAASICGAAEPCPARVAREPELIAITVDPKLRIAPAPDPVPAKVTPPTPIKPRPVIPAAIEPVPFDQWPRPAKWVYRRRRADEGGVGDTVARMVDGKGGKAWKWLYAWITGEVCPCVDRQRRLNLKYPYPTGDVSGLRV